MSSLEAHLLFEELRTLAVRRGAVALGVADMSAVDTSDSLVSVAVLTSLNRALSLAMPLSPAVLATIDQQPNLLYEHHYRQLNFALDRTALEITLRLQTAGFAALPIPASQLVDWSNQRGHLSHKRVAVAAGLGWLGRNNLLVTPGFGARVRLVTVLTNASFATGAKVNGSCGRCRACVAVCPANAIVETAAGFRHMACYEKLKEFQRRHLVSQYICGLCVKVCSGDSASGSSESPAPHSTAS